MCIDKNHTRLSAFAASAHFYLLCAPGCIISLSGKAQRICVSCGSCPYIRHPIPVRNTPNTRSIPTCWASSILTNPIRFGARILPIFLCARGFYTLLRLWIGTAVRFCHGGCPTQWKWNFAPRFSKKPTSKFPWTVKVAGLIIG